MRDDEKFGRWTVVTAYATPGKALVRCTCGTERLVQRGSLASGVSKSCGCLRSEGNTERLRTHGTGYEDYRYRLWQSIMGRCYRPSHANYEDYGARGVTVWEPWHEFTRFRDDLDRLLGPRPEGMTLDRYPDNNGNYEPGNIRWATRKEQAWNRRGRRWRKRPEVSP